VNRHLKNFCNFSNFKNETFIVRKKKLKNNFLPILSIESKLKRFGIEKRIGKSESGSIYI